MAFSSVLQMYLGWANSIMCERGVLIEGLHELQDGVIFCHLIELLTGADLGVGHQNDSDEEEQACLNNTVQVALDYLQSIGVKVKATAAGVVCGELKSILDMLWAVILHCTIHSPDRPVNQRTVRNGRKALLQWCREELHHSASFDINSTMVKNFSHKNLLSDLISVHCSFSNDVDNEDQMMVNLTDAILAAEDHLGISKTLVGPSEVINGTVDEHALLIYVALLRRKVTVLMSRTSSLSSLSSNENIAFKIPMNSRHQIVEALQKAHSFRFIRSQCKGNLRKFVLRLRGLKLKEIQEGFSQTHGASLASIADSSFSSQMSATPKARHSNITTAPSDQTSESGGIDMSETQSVAYVVTNWPNIASPSPQSSPDDKQSPTKSRPFNQPQDTVIQDRLNDQDQRSVQDHQSPSSLPVYEHKDNHPQDSSNDLGQRSGEGVKEVDTNGGGDSSVEMKQQQRKGVDGPLYERQPKPSSKGDGIQKAEDELLGLLEAISLESSHLRQELSESQLRENTLKEELDRSSSAAEEHVVSKLVQELEMLRAENRRLFRDSASARNSNVHDKRTTEKLQATITRLQNDVDHLNSENFRLNLKIKLLESHKVQDGREGADGQESEGRGHQAFKDQEALQQVAADVFLMDQFLDLPSGSSTSEELVRHLSTNQQLLGNFSDVNVQLASKLSELNDELTNTKVSCRRVEQENRLLRMTAETSKLEVDTTASRCHRLEDHLSLAQKKNAKLVQDLQAIAKNSVQDTDKTHTFLKMRQLEEENTLLQQRMELAVEDRQLLNRELEQYKRNQSSIEAMLRGRSEMSSREVTEESGDQQDIARERVMQSVRGKDEREAAVSRPLSNGNTQQYHMNETEDIFKDNPHGDYVRSRTDTDQIKVTVAQEIPRLNRQKPYDNVAQNRVRKPSLGDLIVARANSPRSEDESENPTSQSEMSEVEDDDLSGTKYEHTGLVSHRERIERLSKPSVAIDEMTDDDMKVQTIEDTNIHTQPRDIFVQVKTEPKSGRTGSKFSTVNSTMTHLRGITEKAKHESPNSPDGKQIQSRQSNDSNLQEKAAVVPQVVEERPNPRLARLQELRRSLGIDNSGGNSSKEYSGGGTPGKPSEFEIRSRLSASRRGRIAKWNKFNSYKAEDDDLGSSYLDPSPMKSTSLPSIGTSQKGDTIKGKSTPATSMTSLSSGGYSGTEHQRMGLGNVSLDEYVQALKYRVKSLEAEADDWSDEYFNLPEHFQEPRRLAERSPKRNITKDQQLQDESLSATCTSSVSSENITTSIQKVAEKEKKTEIVVKKEIKERRDCTATLMPFPNRVSGDGMSEGHAQYGEVVTEDEQGTNSDESLKNANIDESASESHQSESNPAGITVKSPSDRTKVKRTPSPARTKFPNTENQEEVDSLVETIIADSSISSPGGTDKLHLSKSEEAKSYKHQLLKEDEQEYANTIIEKYLEQLSVLPQ